MCPDNLQSVSYLATSPIKIGHQRDVWWLTARALDLEHLTTTARIADVQAMLWVPETSRTDADQVIHRRGCQSMIRRWR